ncbi:MAG: triose-phosphate isomerase [Candidatus Jorgensenbacteria bacterium]|nr:triose-phosphate isomerase [Candidatus Jorgensenbacteria bacterium]
MKKLIVANWKMNPATVAQAIRLARAEDAPGVVIAPPFPFLGAVRKVLKKSHLGAQDAFWIPKGAYTGKVSAHQLKHLRVMYVIIGHSERRALGDTDEIVNKKVKAAFKEGLKVVLCVGEPRTVRRQGIGAAKRFVAAQLKKGLTGTKNLKLKTKNLIVAYEPVWAIGSGTADKPAEAAAMARFVKDFLKTKNYKLTTLVLYGGSVTSRNAAAFLGQEEIDGALVGGASLSSQQLRKIIFAARSIQ